MCMWTKSYLINLHCVYIYLYILHIIYICLIVALFSDDWLLPFDDNITFSLPVESRLSYDITFSIYYFIYVTTRVQQFEKNEIKLMFFPKSHILFAEEGRPVGPIDWWCTMIERWRCTRWARLEVKWHQGDFWGVPGERESRVGAGVYTYLPHHLSTTCYLLLARSDTWWIPGEIPVIGCRAHGPILSS